MKRFGFRQRASQLMIMLASAIGIVRGSGEPCQKAYDAELTKAQQAGLTDVEDFLKSFEPIPVFDVDLKVVCSVKLIDDLVLEQERFIITDWPPEKFAKVMKGNLIRDKRGIPLTQEALDKAPWVPAGFINPEDKQVLLGRQVTLPSIAHAGPGGFPRGVDDAAKSLKMDLKALQAIAARWNSTPCQYGQAATVKVCKEIELSSSKPPVPATRADFAGLHLGDRLPDALVTLARGGYVADVNDKYATLHVTCTAKSVTKYVIYPCNISNAGFKKKDASGNSYSVLLEFTEMPSATAENRQIRLSIANPAASVVAAEPGLGNVLVARITGSIQLPYSTNIGKYMSLAMEKYPDLTDKWDPALIASAASQPRTGHFAQKSLVGSKDHCKYYDVRAAPEDYTRQAYTNCIGVGIYGEDGLVVAIGDAWFAYLRNEKTEQGMVEAAKKLDRRGAAPKF